MKSNKAFFISVFVLLAIIVSAAAFFIKDRVVDTPPIGDPPMGIENKYVHPLFKYSISVPEELQIVPNGGTNILIMKKEQEPGPGPVNFIYISVVTPDTMEDEGNIYNYNPGQFERLMGLKIGKSVAVADIDQPGIAERFTYTRVDDTKINGLPVKRYENTSPWEFPNGTTETRYVLENDGYIYILGSYTGGDSVGVSALDPRVAHQVISTFKPGVPIETGWKQLNSSVYGFTILYPEDLDHQTTTEGERFLKVGPTQSLGTELFDGISLVIRSGYFESGTFEDLVAAKYDEIKNDQTQPQLGEKKQISIAGKEGYIFSVSGLGEWTQTYLPKGNNEYIEIINNTVEPSNREQTYKKIVDKMLDTLAY
ncbi:hypothetical protein C4561_03340 [candidate division WWE3 bacterium]|jgi:hypothetical protein|uniref:Uncharacterized protein n=1 Tax=candidate division WWE3 bacterium TaxID=2053526 RepID=A0A3A4ZJE9_UNCKA|nr:MAG: hypothetical protein C4561_03340 [candidate division WWE3 bacterium]